MHHLPTTRWEFVRNPSTNRFEITREPFHIDLLHRAQLFRQDWPWKIGQHPWALGKVWPTFFKGEKSGWANFGRLGGRSTLEFFQIVGGWCSFIFCGTLFVRTNSAWSLGSVIYIYNIYIYNDPVLYSGWRYFKAEVFGWCSFYT